MTRFILKSMLAALTASLVALPLQARDTIQIVGSSTVYPFATVVAEKLGKKIGKTPVIESSGTGGGELMILLLKRELLQSECRPSSKHFLRCISALNCFSISPFIPWKDLL